MKSIRLNNNIREAIATKIMAAYDQNNPEPEVVDTRDDILREALWQYYLEDTHAAQDALNKAPELRQYVRKTAYFYVRLNGTTHTVTPPKTEDGTSQAILDINPSSDYFYQWNGDETPEKIDAVLVENAKQAKGIRKQREAYSAWELARNAYLDSVNQVIQNVNTTGQLLTVWPEVETFLPTGTIDPSRIQLPSVNVASLNAAIGV